MFQYFVLFCVLFTDISTPVSSVKGNTRNLFGDADANANGQPTLTAAYKKLLEAQPVVSG